MGTGHSHGPAPEHAGGRFRARLAAAFGLTAAFFAVELTVGLLSGSLALISDAGHMAADVVALGASLVATRIATRPDRSGRRTYGSYRAEVFASGLTVLIMLGVGIYVLLEGISRILELQTQVEQLTEANARLVEIVRRASDLQTARTFTAASTGLVAPGRRPSNAQLRALTAGD